MRDSGWDEGDSGWDETCADASTRTNVRAAVHRRFKTASRKFGVRVTPPRVVESRRSPKSRPGLLGRYNRHQHKIQLFLDPHLCRASAYERTYAHEMAHAIARKTKAGRLQPAHGAAWKAAMRSMGEPVPARYNKPEYDKFARLKNRFAWLKKNHGRKRQRRKKSRRRSYSRRGR